MMGSVYHRARELAMSNGREYHLAALLRRGKQVVRMGANVSKTHPRFKRTYSDGTTGSHMHAEMNVIRFAEPGDVLEVMRFGKRKMAMAKPCEHCMHHIKEAGIKKIRYTNARGTWEEIKIR